MVRKDSSDGLVYIASITGWFAPYSYDLLGMIYWAVKQAIHSLLPE
jgi:hypothetical protein